jgi:hypothetical protein
MKLKGLAGALFAMEKADEVKKAKAEGRPLCIECGWPCDDPELDICEDCYGEQVLKQFGETA